MSTANGEDDAEGKRSVGDLTDSLTELSLTEGQANDERVSEEVVRTTDADDGTTETVEESQALLIVTNDFAMPDEVLCDQIESILKSLKKWTKLDDSMINEIPLLTDTIKNRTSSPLPSCTKLWRGPTNQQITHYKRGGFTSPTPKGDAVVSSHVNQNDFSTKETRFISHSLSPLVALKFRTRFVFCVDSSLVRGRAFDLSSHDKIRGFGNTSANFAVNLEEVLLVGFVPQDCTTLIDLKLELKNKRLGSLEDV